MSVDECAVTVGLHCRSQLFADDLKLYRKLCSVIDLDLQQDSLDGVMKWCAANGMALNINKCLSITVHQNLAPLQRDYTIDDIVLRQTSEVKELGVVFTQTICWDYQI